MSSNPAPSATVDDAAADLASSTTGSDAGSHDEVSVDPAVPADVSGVLIVVLDQVALDLARAAAVTEAGIADHVGELLVAVAEDDIAVTATFEAKQPGYQGWHWSVTLAVLDEQAPTVSEVVLLPGQGALLAPVWIPWDQRIRAGDVGVGDLLPPPADDPRVVPAYLQSDDPAVEAVARELGIGRVRVLSRDGRIEFAERLHEGSFGPSDEMALSAPAQCVTCAFYLPLAGSLGGLAGACGNEFSPADGRVVDAGYGCGAHSETVIEMPARSFATDTVIDELALEVHRRPIAEPTPDEPLASDDDLPLPDDVLVDDDVLLPDDVLVEDDVLLPDDVLVEDDVLLPDDVLDDDDVPLPDDVLVDGALPDATAPEEPVLAHDPAGSAVSAADVQV